VLESVLVVRHTKVAQATERPSRAGLRLESEEAAERLPRLAVAVDVVEGCRQVPPALVPSRPELHALAVEADRLGQAVAFPRARRPARDVREGGGGGGRGSRRGEQHAGQEQRAHGSGGFLTGAGSRGSPRYASPPAR